MAVVGSAAVAVIAAISSWKSSTFCNSSADFIQPTIITVFQLVNFSCAWLVNLGFSIAGTREIAKIW